VKELLKYNKIGYHLPQSFFINYKNKLDGQGKARREAARRRNSECKINLSCRNSSRSNDSWRMSPRSTKYSAAAIGRRSDQ